MFSYASRVIEGGKRGFTAAKMALSGKDTAVAAQAVLSGMHARGMSGVMRGALYGAAGGAALNGINNVSNGYSPLDGMMGSAFRGALYGGAAGYGLSATSWLGGGAANFRGAQNRGTRQFLRQNYGMRF